MAKSRKPGKAPKTAPADRWRRVEIAGTLTALTPLHIGSGDSEFQAVFNHRGESEQQRINVVLRDGQNRPYIPGSTLRGFLRSQVPEGETLDRLFGKARQPADSAEVGRIGALRVGDASLLTTQTMPERVFRNSIDPLTGTTREHFLAGHEQVLPGSSFSVVLYLHAAEQDITKEDIALLLAALKRASDLGIGGSRSIGLGRLAWSEKPSITGLSAVKLKGWFRKERNVWKSSRPIRSKMSASERWRAAFQPLNASLACDSALTAQARQSMTVELRALSQVLVGGSADREDKASGRKPQIVAFQRGSCFVIPGSTLKGWLRAQARRILLTLTQGTNEAQVDQALGELFGSLSAGQSAISCFDMLCTKAKPVQRSFNAVDRFSGGVKNTALFSAQVVPRGSTFIGQISIDLTKLQEWMKLLLLFVFRDASEGDLVLGWGKARGLGELQLDVTSGAPEWLSVQSSLPPTSWESALLTQIGALEDTSR